MNICLLKFKFFLPRNLIQSRNNIKVVKVYQGRKAQTLLFKLLARPFINVELYTIFPQRLHSLESRLLQRGINSPQNTKMGCRSHCSKGQFLHEMDQEYQQLEAVRGQAERELWGRHFENPLYLMLEDGTG